jgi:protein gp37
MFDTMERCPRHTFMLLTKRAERMLEYSKYAGWKHEPEEWPWPPKNVWWGTSVGHPDFKSRIDDLRKIDGPAVRFLSLEPLVADLGDLDLRGIHWAIAGGESGRGARPLDLEWLRSIREACRRSGTAFFCKQLGSVWARERGQASKGGDPSFWPEDLRIREWPGATAR